MLRRHPIAAAAALAVIMAAASSARAEAGAEVSGTEDAPVARYEEEPEAAEATAEEAAAEEATAEEAAAEEAAAEEATADDPAVLQARETFRLGSALARQGQWSDALAAFERSARLRPHPVTRYNIGYVLRALGQYTRAHASFRRALEPRAAGPALPEDLAAQARAYLAEISDKLARVTVTLADPELAVSVGGRPLEVLGDAGHRVLVAGTRDPGRPERVPGRTFELWVSPGTHMIVLAREGHPDTVLTKTFESGSTAALHLAPDSPAPQAEPPRPPPMGADVRADLPAAPDRTWMWVAYGAGAAGLVTGGVFGALALSRKSTLDEHCTKVDTERSCDPDFTEFDRTHSALGRYANIATIGFAAGAVGAGLGTFLLLTEPGAPPSGAGTARARPPKAELRAWVGPASVGLGGRF